MQILPAKSEEHLLEVKQLFQLYYDELLKIDTDIDEFKQELAALPGEYAEPEGALLLLVDKEILRGCVALRKIDEHICELKRLYVLKEHRGGGYGRVLAEAILDEARQRNFGLIRLDTLTTLDPANGLYQSLGFQQIEPYLEDMPVELLYWGLEL